MVATADILVRQRASLRAFLELFVGGSPGARLLPTPAGITALVCPARPERSLVNAVVYADADALAAALPALAAAYDAEGIQAWTVWVGVGDERAAAACAAAGHVLDATPQLMWAPLDAVAPPVLPRGVTLDRAPSWRVLGDLNDAAYGLPPDHLAITLQDADPDRCLRAVAVEGGRPVACAAAHVVGDDAHAILVATLPEARGRGLATACLADVLDRARAAGAVTTTLEATALGAPVYARMGYRSLGSLGMWERRRSAP